MLYGDAVAETRCMELVMGIAFKLRREADAVFRTEGLTYPQYGVLLALAGREGLSQREGGGARRDGHYDCPGDLRWS